MSKPAFDSWVSTATLSGLPRAIPAVAPPMLVSIVGIGGAWLWLVHAQWFAAFDPSDPKYLCLAWGRAALSGEALWQASIRWLFDGMVMVVAMMLPTALRASTQHPPIDDIDARRRPLGAWLRWRWLVGYGGAWTLALTAVVVTLVALQSSVARGAGFDGSSVLVVLAVLAGVIHLGRALRGAWLVPALSNGARSPPTDPMRRASGAPQTLQPWSAGALHGTACIARCALPMAALHGIHGMSTAMMASYAFASWWRAGSWSPWPDAAIAAGLFASAFLG
jgi:hypothetical protein